MTTISASNVILFQSDQKVAEKSVKVLEDTTSTQTKQENEAVVSEVRARDSIQNEEEALALAGVLRQNILSNTSAAFQAQANQKPDEIKILLA